MKIILTLIFVPTLICAQSYSPTQLAQFAQEHAPVIQAQILSEKAQKTGISQAKILGNPEVTVMAGGIRTAGETHRALEVTLGQPIPWPGKRAARIQGQEYLFSLSQLETEEVKLSVAHRVYILSMTLAAYQEIDERNVDRKKKFELVNSYLKNRNFASPRQRIEKDLISTQLKMVEMDMLQFRNEMKATLWELELLTNKNVERVVVEWSDIVSPINENDFLLAYEESPIRKKLRISQSLQENKVKEARLENRPDIIVGVNYRQEQVEPVNHFIHGVVGIQIPIIDRGQHQESIAKAELNRVMALNNLENHQHSLKIKKLISQITAQKTLMQLFPVKSIKGLEQKYRESFDAFSKGLIDATTFLESDSQIHQSLEQVYYTRNQYHQYLSELQQIVGKNPEL